jgi:hypothetical protein
MEENATSLIGVSDKQFDASSVLEKRWALAPTNCLACRQIIQNLLFEINSIPG